MIKISGVLYDFDMTDITVAEARWLKREFGWTLLSWAEALKEYDPDALAMVGWLAQKHAGSTAAFDDFDVSISALEFGVEDPTEPAAVPAATPEISTTPSATSEIPTSLDSPTTSASDPVTSTP